MTTSDSNDFLAGVIEGFYGLPWTPAERLELFGWMAKWGLNTYLYAPKDDLKQRAAWREAYSEAEAATLRALVEAAHARGIRFFYALSPGLDMEFSSEADRDLLRKRFAQLLELGCRHFSLLFDDLPGRISENDRARWGSLAAAQASVANDMFAWVRERIPEARFLFCPTPYCSRMAARKLGGEGYLEILGRELKAEIDIFWTGPEIIAKEITVEHAQELRKVLRRKPLIWDNIHANDYDGRRYFCGPYAGRPPEVRAEVSGLLSNPNNELALNFVPLRTLGAFVKNEGNWDERAAWLEAMREWFPYFETSGKPIGFEDLTLFFDCQYLPYEEGAGARELHARARELLTTDPATWGEKAEAFRKLAGRVREMCSRITELRHRPIFYAIARRVWELREEMDLLDGYVALRSNPATVHDPYLPDYQLPETYRGGLVAKLQKLLVQHADGSYTPAITVPPKGGTPNVEIQSAEVIHNAASKPANL